MRTQRVARVGAGATIALLLIAFPGAGQAASGDPGAIDEVRHPVGSEFSNQLPEGPAREQSPEEAERDDTAAIAEAQGWTFEEAKHRLRFDEEFSEFAVRLRRNHPDALAAIWQEDAEHDRVFFVRFVGPIPESARAWAEELGLKINFMDDGTSSERELERRARDIHNRVRARGFVNMGSAAASHLKRIELEITRPEAYRGGQRDDELEERLPQSARASDVIVRFIDDPVVVSEQALAGAWVGRNGAAHCTSGFVVSHDDVPRGITTAAHCSIENGDLNVYQDPETNLLYPMTLHGSDYGQWGDVEWHETTHPQGHVGWFHAGYNVTRRVHTVLGQWGFTVGQDLCVFGRNTGRACAQVQSTSTSCDDLERLVVMDSDVTSDTDSGGPWYRGRKAAGIHMGTCRGDSAFSKAAHVDQTAMSIDVVARDRKVRNETMNPNTSIWSPNGKYELRMQGDGNLVVYRLTDGSVIWATSQFGVPNIAGSFAVMQKQGNFVHYRPNGVAHWGTPASPWGNKLLMQNDGNLVVYKPNEAVRWATSCAAGGIGPC